MSTTTYPTSPRAAFMQWCQTHGPVFLANAEEIGLTPAQASQYNALISTATQAILAQNAQQQLAKMATVAATNAVDALMTGTGETVKLIRAFAESQTNPTDVYTLAQIPPPSSPSPVPPPGQPTNLSVELMPRTGELVLRWKCTNPPGGAGTSYFVKRRLPGETAWTFIGPAQKKEFVDNTFVAGPDRVEYMVQAIRSGILGVPSQVFLVSFGVMPGGATMAKPSNAVGRGMQLAVTAMGPDNGNGHGRVGR